MIITFLCGRNFTKHYFRLDNFKKPLIIKNEERTTHAVAPQFRKTLDVDLTSHESFRHLAEWRLLFLRSYTMIVTVYLPMWNVIRMVPTSFRRCRSNRLRARRFPKSDGFVKSNLCSPLFDPYGHFYCIIYHLLCQLSMTVDKCCASGVGIFRCEGIGNMI